ncbi:uncharacterized protein ATC70_004564 [Mucor velutinosus]|uniref:Rho-GAP domain-containing protein n=1 Tax=Mucor velutinosus TaxID=708070 RepID=A0AAN7DSU9_9FUNG|nr:hypothetical protein ATC70_004564 [Mucor velutinosus]
MAAITHKKAHKAKPVTAMPQKEQIVFTGQDKIIHDLIVAPSKEIDAIASNLILRDTSYIIEYLKQRINLEQRYLDDLSTMTKNIQKCCVPSEKNLIQMNFMNYVGLAEQQKPLKEMYIEQLKQQCENLVQFRNDQQKSFDKNKAWMNHVNGDYLIARLKKLPTAHEIYIQKWDEIERSAGGTAVASPMLMTPMTPTLSVGSTLTSQHSDDLLESRAMSMDDDRTRKFADVVNATQSSRIERFMKRHLNKPEDATSRNIKMAKLKVEVGEADTNYRNVVRELSTMAIKIDATNLHILHNVQASLKEKSDKVKNMLQAALKADLRQLEQGQHPVNNLLASVDKINNEHEAKKFNASSTAVVKKYPKPEPIYYENHHVGVCKDLIFGTSLTEYAQQRNRSPPLLITKCINAIERLGGLEKEGIYRVSGKQSNMEKIKHAFELDEEAVIIGQNDVPEDVVSIASVIKIFLRELKSPLFPFKLTDRLVYSQIPDQELRLMNLLTRLLKLPPANYDTLKALIHHLSKLHAHVEKNKMTTNNLTLIFTPAIFQDLNHAQNSPGEWAKDCVLEDLIMNSQDIFANKDLHNNSAITGDIEYGFHQSSDEHHHEPNRYAMTIQSPDSPTGAHHEETESEYSFVIQDEDDDGTEDDFMIKSVTTSSNDSSVLLHHYNEPEEAIAIPKPTTSSPPPLEEERQEETPSRSTSVERKKYQAHFQGKGLKVNTGSMSSTGSSQSQNNHSDHHIPTIKSATVPSYDWLALDPDNAPPVPKLRRSATTGKKVLSRRKLSSNQLRADAAAAATAIPVPDIPRVPILNYRSNTNGGGNINITSSTSTIP